MLLISRDKYMEQKMESDYWRSRKQAFHNGKWKHKWNENGKEVGIVQATNLSMNHVGSFHIQLLAI